MRKQIGLLSMVGLFGLSAIANAQPSSAPTPGATFDGEYRFVSSAKINATYVTRGGQMGQGPDRSPGPLTIARGKARYTSGTGRQLTGTVGPQGELAMRLVGPPGSNGYRPTEISVDGTVDGTGTVHARQRSNPCSYDFVWQK